MSRVLVQEYNSYMINEVAWYCGFEETTFIVSVSDKSNLNYLNYAVLDEFRKFCDDAVVFLSYSVADCGVKPDGTEWRVGIQDIDKPTGTHMMVTRNMGGSTVTSGIYERGFSLDGVRYHHLLSPATGWPVQNELASVTIFSESSMEGDALSTAAFVLGTEQGLELIESLEGIEAVFIARDRSVTCSSGAKDYLIR